jgi:protein-glucosylgalactosylhydroxylysine glucosidase
MAPRSPLLAVAALSLAPALCSGAIDRETVVRRHTISASSNSSTPPNSTLVLTLGNGGFGFNADVTGLQSLNGSYTLFDLNTLTDWGFHSLPFPYDDPSGTTGTYALSHYNFSYLTTPLNGKGDTREVPYIVVSNVTADATTWLHDNPHRLSLGQLSLRRTAAAASPPTTTTTVPLVLADVLSSSQSLDVYAGVLSSNFSCGARAGTSSPFTAEVLTTVHPVVDLVATRVVATAPAPTLVGPVAVHLAFGYGTEGAPGGANWSPSTDALHTTTVVDLNATAGSLTLLRQLDSDAYNVYCAWSDPAWTLARAGPHSFDLLPPSGAGGSPTTLFSVEMSCLFAPLHFIYPIAPTLPWMQQRAAASAQAVESGLPLYSATAAAAGGMWSSFWSEGAFVDLASNTDDPDAFELERRVVLSLYLTRANSAGAAPPQETGLLCNSWAGKHHQEMRFWHQSHWPLWGHTELLQRSDGFYFDILANSTAYAAFQGYKGARWPKMVATIANRSGIDVPWLGLSYAPFPFANGSTDGFGSLAVMDVGSSVGPLLLWEQPHVIWMADLQRRAVNASQGPAAALALVASLSPLVTATADFLASFAFFNESDGKDGAGAYNLGPPIIGGEESGNFALISNPVFELVQMGYALDVANEWRAFLGLPPNPDYDAVASKLGPLTLDIGSPPTEPVYSFNRACACAYRQADCPKDHFNLTQCPSAASHPMTVGPVGMVNGLRDDKGARYGLDLQTANNTIAAVVREWYWDQAWGWDVGLTALAQVRLGWSPEAVVQTLLLSSVKNIYNENGYNFQTPGLPAYLPGNGATLLAVAAMAGGMEGGLSPVAAFPAAWGAVVEGFAIPYP